MGLKHQHPFVMWFSAPLLNMKLLDSSNEIQEICLKWYDSWWRQVMVCPENPQRPAPTARGEPPALRHQLLASHFCGGSRQPEVLMWEDRWAPKMALPSRIQKNWRNFLSENLCRRKVFSLQREVWAAICNTSLWEFIFDRYCLLFSKIACIETWFLN